MIVTPKLPPQGPSETPSQIIKEMKGVLILSGAFHLAVFIALTAGLPFLPEKDVILSPPVNVEIIDVSEIAQTNNPKPAQKTKTEEPKKEEPPPKSAPPEMTAEAPPDLTEPEPPKTEEIAKADPIPPPEPIKKPAKKPEPPKKKEKKPEPTKTVEKKASEKPKEDTDTQKKAMDSLLKNMLASENNDNQNSTEPAAGTTPDVAQLAELANRLTISEQDALRKQLSQCWYVNSGSAYAETLAVELRVYMNPDRTVQRADILDQLRYTADAPYRAAADAAVRALRNPKCSPLELPPTKFENWKTFVVRFDPKEML